MVVKTLEVILHEEEHQQYGTETPWNWDRDTLSKESSYYYAICSFQFIVSLVVFMKTLAIIKLVSVKLQKSNDIIQAYKMISRTEELQDARENAEQVFKEWYAYALQIGEETGVEPAV